MTPSDKYAEPKNASKLKSFIAYCEEHPSERFWQALRNWSGHALIMYQDIVNRQLGEIRDTFYIE